MLAVRPVAVVWLMTAAAITLAFRSGFISASGILIATSQLKTLMGVKAEGHKFVDLALSLLSQLSQVHVLTLAIGAVTVSLLF